MGDDGGGEPVRAPILVLPHGFDALPDQLLHAIRRCDESLATATRRGCCGGGGGSRHVGSRGAGTHQGGE